MGFDIVDDRLEINGRACTFVKAASFGSRFHPTLITLHDTADRPAPLDTVRYFASAECKVSAHVVVERSGLITQMVPFDMKAFHAGQSSWNGVRFCNNQAVGIEIDNPGCLDKNGRAWFHKKTEPGFPLDELQHVKTKAHGDGWWMPYTPEQIDSVIQLCTALIEEYPTIKEIVTHWLISPGRKVDTNPLFPLEEVRAAVFTKRASPGRPALYPKLSFGDRDVEPEGKIWAAQSKLKELGYPVGDCDGAFGPQMRVAVLAFEAENKAVYDGALDPEEHKLLMLGGETVKPMPVGARESLTAEDLLARGSETVKWTQRGKKFISGVPLLGALLGGGDQAVNDGAGIDATLKGVEATRLQAEQVSSLFGWIVTPAGITIAVLLVMLGLTWFVLDKVEKRRVKDARTGANIAR